MTKIVWNTVCQIPGIAPKVILNITPSKKTIDELSDKNIIDIIKGDEVIVTSGPLKGLDGIVLNLKGDSKIIMKIEAIKQALSVEISEGQLKLKKKNVSSVL